MKLPYSTHPLIAWLASAVFGCWLVARVLEWRSPRANERVMWGLAVTAAGFITAMAGLCLQTSADLTALWQVLSNDRGLAMSFQRRTGLICFSVAIGSVLLHAVVVGMVLAMSSASARSVSR